MYIPKYTDILSTFWTTRYISMYVNMYVNLECALILIDTAILKDYESSYMENIQSTVYIFQTFFTKLFKKKDAFKYHIVINVHA